MRQMITFSIIEKKDLEGADRLDAEYYQPDNLNILHKLNNIGYITIRDANGILDCSAFYPSITAYYNSNKEGMPFLRVNEIQDGIIEITDNTIFLPEHIITKYKNNISVAEPGDIVIAKGGNTLGKVSLLTDLYPKYAICRDLIVLKTGNLNKINKYYLWLFLHSSIGQKIILRTASQTGQPHLTLNSIYDLKIPIIEKQDKFEELFNNSLNLKMDSIKMLYDAENLLLKELGLKDFKPKDNLSFIVDLDEVVRNSDRIDPDYFQPKYNNLLISIKHEIKSLKELATRKNTKIKINNETKYKYIEISDINVNNGETTFNNIKGSRLPANAKIELNGGELLISKVRPTRQAISIIPEKWSENFIASGAFSVYDLPSPLKEYIQVVLRSIIGSLQFERPTTGTSYPTITDQDVENISIPLLSQDKQQKIAELVRKSHEARKKSKDLLQEAKRKVEDMIEQNSRS